MPQASRDSKRHGLVSEPQPASFLASEGILQALRLDWDCPCSAAPGWKDMAKALSLTELTGPRLVPLTPTVPLDQPSLGGPFGPPFCAQQRPSSWWKPARGTMKAFKGRYLFISQ